MWFPGIFDNLQVATGKFLVAKLTPCHDELCKSKVFLHQRLQLNSCRTIVELIFLQVPFSRRISIFQSASISSAPLLRLPACSPAHEMYESGGGGGGV